MPLPAAAPASAYEPSADEARRELARELARAEYAQALPSPVLSFLRDVRDAFLQWLASLESVHPNLGAAVLVLAALAAAGALAWAARRRMRRRHAARERPAVGLETGVSSADYRRRAEAAEAAGDWSGAALGRFRALVRAAEERTLVDEQPGRTAFEAAYALAAAFPGHADALDAAATLFNAVHYGHHAASAADAGRIARLDADLAAAVPSADGVAAAGWAVPR